MGCESSEEGVYDPLVAQEDPGLSITGFKTASLTILNMKSQWSCSGADWTIRDHMKNPVMRLDTSCGFKGSCRLLSMDGRVLTKAKSTSIWSCKHNIYFGESDQVVATLRRGNENCMSSIREFIVWGVDGQMLYLIQGSTWHNEWVIRNARGEVVAKFGSIQHNNWSVVDLQIAQGMDAAVVIIIAGSVYKIISQEDSNTATASM